MSKQTITATTLEGSHVCVPEAQFEAFIAAWERANSTCIWQQDGEESDIWETQCHQVFVINDGDPSDNSMAYCCFCGRRLEESPWPEDEDEAGGEG